MPLSLGSIVAKLAGAAVLLGSLASASAQAPVPVKIGILNDQTSVYSSISGEGSVVAARLAVEDMGESVLGRPIEIVVADHGHKPDVGSAIARRWFDTEGVGAIFDIYSSGVTLAVQKVAEDKNRILAITMASSGLIGGTQCSPNGMHWANAGYEVSKLTTLGSGEEPTTCFFLTVDYAAGHSIEAEATRMVTQAGGKVLGSVRFPLGTPDFSSFLLRAQGSGTKKIGLIGGGADLTNSMKQAAEFGLAQSGQRFVPFSLTTADIYGVGNGVARGMPVVLSYYWDENDDTKRWAARFRKMFGRMPSDPQANVYSAVLHYLQAVKAAGTTDTAPVLAKMKEMPVDDMFTKGARVRADGRLMRDVWYAEVKAPDEMANKDDLLKLVRRIKAEDAFIPARDSECRLLH